MTKTYQFRALLTEQGWQKNACVKVDARGNILSFDGAGSTEVEPVPGYALPGFQNAHSHAFQYALCGLGEWHHSSMKADDFWAWRTRMYDLALRLSPDDFQTIATMLYAEMLRHGYTEVAEFHYLHHDSKGQAYNNRSEMGERLCQAALDSGIKLTLVPIFYQQGGFNQPPSDEQRRFISPTLDDYLRLVDSTTKMLQGYPNCQLGLGIHSLRAVAPSSLKALFSTCSTGYPFHMHIAEQEKEVNECIAHLGLRPVQWLLEHVALSSAFHLVHATHMDEQETTELAKSKAHVVLCPSTEGNLADGLFPLTAFQRHGGKWSIGSDSQINLNPFEELRWLDYGQRLISHRRTTYVDETSGNSALNAISMALHSGRNAMQRQAPSNFFSIGSPFDALVIGQNHPLIASCAFDHLTNTLLYCHDASQNLGTIVNGQWWVKQGHHRQREALLERFKGTLQKLDIR